MSKTIIIGDVHGCYDKLITLLTNVKFSKENDTIVFVGDLMDRGQMSYECFTYVQNLKNEMVERCHYVLGNHEHMMCNSITSSKMNSIWLNYNGGEDTLNQFNSNSYSIYDAISWIKENTEVFYETEKYIVCHGGASSDDIHNDSVDDIVWNRECVEYGGYDGKLLIVGHTPLNFPIYSGYVDNKLRFEELSYNKIYSLDEYKTGCIDIDTGCVFDGDLTAMVVEDNNFTLIK